jgi:biotin operon repressor
MTLSPLGDGEATQFFRYRSTDRMLALLGIYGPMTVAVLADHLTRSRGQVNSQLQRLRKRGQVELIEPRTYVIGPGPRCGRWRVIRDP